MDENKLPDNIVPFPIRDKTALFQRVKAEIAIINADIADRKLRLKDEEDSLAYEKEKNPDYNFSGLEPRIEMQKEQIAALEKKLAEKIAEKEELMNKD
ncbi:MAG TPA: hypothetical protein P5096_02370 [Patescibacteria group bacterium]|nr:hypothetical protein [Patescibacteria group bacterium]